MNALVDRLLEQLRLRGLSVVPGDRSGQLKLIGRTAAADAAVLDAVKAFKAEILARVGSTPKPELAPAVETPKPEPEASAPDPEPVLSERQRVLAEIQLRAGKRAIYGFRRDKGSCAQLTRDVPADWDYVCVEGDAQWTYLPREEGEP